MKASRSRPVEDEYRLKGSFIEGLRLSIRQSVRSYWAKDKHMYPLRLGNLHCLFILLKGV